MYPIVPFELRYYWATTTNCFCSKSTLRPRGSGSLVLPPRPRQPRIPDPVHSPHHLLVWLIDKRDINYWRSSYRAATRMRIDSGAHFLFCPLGSGLNRLTFLGGWEGKLSLGRGDVQTVGCSGSRICWTNFRPNEAEKWLIGHRAAM